MIETQNSSSMSNGLGFSHKLLLRHTNTSKVNYQLYQSIIFISINKFNHHYKSAHIKKFNHFIEMYVILRTQRVRCISKLTHPPVCLTYDPVCSTSSRAFLPFFRHPWCKNPIPVFFVYKFRANQSPISRVSTVCLLFTIFSN